MGPLSPQKLNQTMEIFKEHDYFRETDDSFTSPGTENIWFFPPRSIIVYSEIQICLDNEHKGRLRL